MAMMMAGRVLLVCALCVLWCGVGCGFAKEEDTQDEFCNSTYLEFFNLLANKNDAELKEKYCKNEDDETKCVNTLKNNIADAMKKEKTEEDNAADRDPNVAHASGVPVGSSTKKSSTAAGVNNAGVSPPITPTLKVEGDVDAKVNSPVGGAGPQPRSDDVRSETERIHLSEAEGSNQHSVDVQYATIHSKDEETPQTGLQSTEAREGTEEAPAPSQDPPNTDESHEDKSRKVTAPGTIPAENTSSGSNQEQKSQSSSPSGSDTTGSLDNEGPEKNFQNAQISDATLKDEGQHRESTAGNEYGTTVQSAAEQGNTTTPGDSDDSTAAAAAVQPEDGMESNPAKNDLSPPSTEDAAQLSTAPDAEDASNSEENTNSQSAGNLNVIIATVTQRNDTTKPTDSDSDGSTAVSHTTSPLLLLLVACAAAAAVVAA
ncbi:mucin-associated surface protein [Trypanosoma cruzi cruzi]|uniref:Mucin-associated surface protein (MASP) n=1 Tax=Trypanosoma cruzi TaxID=5693 RepID=A0A2V2VTF3_TRYCR|nr:mucin-associated surface protein [Trypanosoma cruzi cruzi]PWU98732.1 Mucin-associated surface protein (MASP) [Trypanosoma cruzi]